MASSKLNRQQKDFLSLLGYNYLKNNKLEKATIVYQALFHLFPESEYFSLCLSYLSLKQNQNEKAVDYADLYFSKSQTPKKLGYFIKGQALFNIGRKSDAKECVKAYLKR